MSTVFNMNLTWDAKVTFSMTQAVVAGSKEEAEEALRNLWQNGGLRRLAATKIAKEEDPDTLRVEVCED